MKEYKISRHRTVGEYVFIEANSKEEALDIVENDTECELDWDPYWNNPESDEYEYTFDLAKKN